MAPTTWKTQDNTHDFTLAGTFEVDADAASFMRNIVRMAAIALERGDVREAEGFLRKGLERQPDHPHCLAYLAVCVAARARQFDKAEKLARSIIRENPYDATAHYALGMVYLGAERRRQAFENFDKARELAQGDRYLQGQLARAEPRRQPVLGFLSRNHPLNIWLGRLRTRFNG